MSGNRTLRLGGLVSGGGRTLLNLHQHTESSELPAEVSLVISSRADAPAIERCRSAGLPIEVVDRSQCDEPTFHTEIASLMRDAGVDLICMAGFLSFWRIPDEFAGRVVNIHPALLPAFGGKGFYGNRVHRAVLEAGASETGCTVHFADDEYDHGPIILQRKVPVLPNDTVQALAARVFEAECLAYPEAVDLLIRGEHPFPEPSLQRTH